MNRKTSDSIQGLRRRDEKKARHRQQILDATISCVARYGLSGVTVSRICVQSGLSRGMINAHFESKDNLLLEVVRGQAAEYSRAIEDAVALAGDDPAEALRIEIETEIKFWSRSQDEVRAWVAFRAESLNNPAMKELCGPREATLYAIPKRLCRELTVKGGYGSVDPEQVSRGLTAILEGYWFEYVYSAEDFDPVCASQNCLKFLSAWFPRHF